MEDLKGVFFVHDSRRKPRIPFLGAMVRLLASDELDLESILASYTPKR
jgi:hypothetical protein